MKKRLLSLLVLVCLVCGLLCACGAKKEITADQAVSIVMEDLGDQAKNAGQPHVHPGTYQDKTCYNIYLSVSGEEWIYVISADGEILLKTPGSHSH